MKCQRVFECLESMTDIEKISIIDGEKLKQEDLDYLSQILSPQEIKKKLKKAKGMLIHFRPVLLLSMLVFIICCIKDSKNSLKSIIIKTLIFAFLAYIVLLKFKDE